VKSGRVSRCAAGVALAKQVSGAAGSMALDSQVKKKQMVVGIHKAFFRGYFEYIQRFERLLDHNGISHIRMECDDAEFWSRIRDVDLFLFWWRHDNGDSRLASALIPILENQLKVNCLPNSTTCWTYDDKIRQFYLLRQHGFPMADSWIFWDKQKALDWLNTAAFPLVFKLSGGAGSENVAFVKTRARGEQFVKRMFGAGIQSTRIPWGNTRWHDFNLRRQIRHWAADCVRGLRGIPLPAFELHKNYVYFQKFLLGNAYDTRVTVIGNRAFAFRRFNRDSDFRSSGSGKVDYDTNVIDTRFLKMAFEISKKLSFQSMAYDFLYDENGEVAICEISYNFIDEVVYGCPGYWDDLLDWHEGHWWPQYFQLVDALGMPDLKQPDLT
jgi:glutathione synthase/RimK-type ligase-like ATP-grasp enzyme